MTRPYPDDLRARVAAAVMAWQTCRTAAALFGISVSAASGRPGCGQQAVPAQLGTADVVIPPGYPAQPCPASRLAAKLTVPLDMFVGY